MIAQGTLSKAAALLLVAGMLAGCAGKRIAPYAWAESEDDPRFIVRVPPGTPDSEPVPTRELVRPDARAIEPGEIEWPDARLVCRPEEAEEEFKRNEISLFVGYTGLRAGDGTTLGFGYHRKLRRNFGIALFGEYVFGETQVPVVGTGVVFQPTEETNILLGVGLEFEESHEPGHDRETEPLFRIGGFHRIGKVAGMDVSPAAYLDVVRNKDAVLILGIELGKEW